MVHVDPSITPIPVDSGPPLSDLLFFSLSASLEPTTVFDCFLLHITSSLYFVYFFFFFEDNSLSFLSFVLSYLLHRRRRSRKDSSFEKKKKR